MVCMYLDCLSTKEKPPPARTGSTHGSVYTNDHREFPTVDKKLVHAGYIKFFVAFLYLK